MHLEKGESFHRWILMAMVLLSSFSSTSSSSINTRLNRHQAGFCDKANYGEGPLNLTSTTYSFGSLYEGERALIYHCIRYFTSFRWFRIRSKDDYHVSLDDIRDDNDPRLQPYPWGEGGRVGYPHKRHDNQTIIIPKSKRKDDGMYVFIVQNGTHRVIGKFRLYVFCHDIGPSISIAEQHVQHVARGSSKTLSCAVSVSECTGGFYQAKVYWVWWNPFQSPSQPRLKNSTFNSVSVVCDRNSFWGRKCDVLIGHVEEWMFHGEFVCLTDSGGDVNQTVRLVPIGNDVKTWLPYILSTVGAVAVLMTLIISILRRYRHRIKFWCQVQPGRGHYEADVVIVHGEDHQRVVQHSLAPGVRALGYTLLEVDPTPGKPDLQDQLQAVDKSHSVLLVFSAWEIAEEGRVDFLIRYVFKTKTPSTALFIRCQDNTLATPSATTQQNRVVKDWSILGKQVSMKDCGRKELESFKILDLPGSLHEATSTETRSWRDAREAERFWTHLQKHLPPRSGESSQRNTSPGFRQSCDIDTAERQPILQDEAGTAERESVRATTSQFGTFGSLAGERV